MKKLNSDEPIKKATNIMKTLSHPVRLSILCDLLQNGEMSAGEIVLCQAKRASQSQVSQYLSDFRKKKIVMAKKRGQHVYYTFSSPFLKKMIELLYHEFCEKKS